MYKVKQIVKKWNYSLWIPLIRNRNLPLTTALTSAGVDEQLIVLQLFNRNQYSLPGVSGPWSNCTFLPSIWYVTFVNSLQVELSFKCTMKNWSLPPLNPEIHVRLTKLFVKEYPVKFIGVWGLSETQRNDILQWCVFDLQ